MARNLRSGLRQSLNAGLAGGFASNDIFTTASLDLNFAKYKNIGSLIDFTRLSSGTYVGSDGLIKTATTNEPRFDHDPTTGESLGLLVEESRTNLALYSQDLTVTPTWTEGASSVDLAPTVVDVFGRFTAAYKLTEDNSNSAHSLSQSFTITANTLYSVTAWFKSGSGNRDGRILLTNTAVWNGTIAPRARIEFSTGTVQNVFGFTTTDVIQYPNGWFKFVGTALSSATGGTSAFRYLLSNAGAETYEGDGVSYIYIGPCQLEAAAFPTSYIPTTGSTVTRAADVAIISGANFSSWYRQGQGTVFVEGRTINTVAHGIVSFDDGSLERWRMGGSGTGSVGLVVVDNGNISANTGPGANSWPNDVFVKGAAAIKLNDFGITSKGLSPAVDTSGTVPTVNKMLIGPTEGIANWFDGHLKRITYWPQRLPDSTLVNITT